jgi:hypothetical protein
MDINDAISGRRSTREYTAQAVDEKVGPLRLGAGAENAK